MTTPPLDLAALAREWWWRPPVPGTDDVAELTALLAQSHAAGRAKGLEEAATLCMFKAVNQPDGAFSEACESCADTIRQRALASSDPAPRDDGTVPDRETAWLIERRVSPPQYVASRDDLGSLTMDPWRAARFETEREAFDARLRIIGNELRDECHAVQHVFINKPDPAPAHPVEPGEVERLPEACSSCQFFAPHGPTYDWGRNGLCQRYPTASDTKSVRWCGEFIAAPRPAQPKGPTP